jgi:hypothetical protein
VSARDQDYGPAKVENCFVVKSDAQKVFELECENLALRIEREKLRDMVARYADIAAVTQTGESGKAEYVNYVPTSAAILDVTTDIGTI